MPNFFNKRKPLLRWLGWFFFANTICYWLIGLRYLHLVTVPPTDTVTHTGMLLMWIFVLIAYIGQLALLAFIPCLILCVPLALIFPNRNLICTISVMTATFALLLLIIDTFVYSIYRFHLNSLILNIILHGTIGEVLQLTHAEFGSAIAGLILLALLETLLAVWLWKRLLHKPRNYHGKALTLTLCGCLFTSYVMFIFASGAQAYAMSNLTTGAEVPNNRVIANNHALIMQAQILPFYNTFLAKLLPGTNLQDIETLGSGLFTQPKSGNKKLRYPLTAIQCQPQTKPPNILLIGIDAWRFDMLNAAVTPNIFQFAQSAWIFDHHFSGGNATEPGLFSLFYSIPSTYWNTVVAQEQGPVLIHELLKQNYNLGIFVSAEIYYPPYNRTIFKEVAGLPVSTPGNGPYQRDQYITRSAIKFLKQAASSEKPFFSFVFYNTSHGYCTAANYPKPFQPAVSTCNRLVLSNQFDPTTYLNRYKNAVHFIDNLVAQILQQAKNSNLLNNTIVIITGDHGEEFNDNHLNYWGHASNFTHFQLQTPLIIYWPGQSSPKTFSYRTSHFDLVPTLMQKVLHCKNSSSDYSVGTSLFNPAERNYLIAGSYINFGIVERDRITQIFPSGTLAIMNLNNQSLPNAKPRLQIIQKVFEDIKKYYR